MELGVGLLQQVVGSRSVSSGGQWRSPGVWCASAGQMTAHSLDEFAGEGDPFVEVLGIEWFDKGVWVEGLGAGEESEEPAVLGVQAELQDGFRRRLPRFGAPLLAESCCVNDAEGGLPCFGTGLGLVSSLRCPESFAVKRIGMLF